MPDIELTLKLIGLIVTVCSAIMFPAVRYVVGLSHRQEAQTARVDSLAKDIDVATKRLESATTEIRAMQAACVAHQLNTAKIQEKLDTLLRELESNKKAIELLRDVVYDFMLEANKKHGG